jgi:membrane-associated protease RseP (regulator of RpoE activity)
LLAKLAVFGRMLPAPAQFDIPPILFWLRTFVTGYQFPMPGVDVFLHPIADAAWAGLMITGLNLIPVGQLDGGHMLFVLLGKKADRFWPIIIAALVILSFFWGGWLLLALLLFFLGRMHAEPLDGITPLSPKHRAVALLGLLLFLLLFTPIPLQVFGG